MNYRALSDSELLHSVSGLHDVDANQEWYNRHGMNLPYRLDMFGRILNCMSHRVMDDSIVDRLIVEQAKEVRALKQLNK